MSMFTRLFLLIGLVSTISLGLVAGLLWGNAVELESQLRQENESAGERLQQNGTVLLEQSLSETHQTIVDDKASRAQSYINHIAYAVQLEAALVQQSLADGGSLANVPPLFEGNTLTGMARQKPSLRKTLVAVAPYTMYHLAPGVSLKTVAPEMSRLRRLGGFLSHTQSNLPGCDSTYFGGALGFIQGYPGGTTYFKNAYDPRQRPWYKQATAPGLKPGSLVWSVDVDRDGKTYFLTCARSVTLPGQTKPVGVAAMDVQVTQVLNEMFAGIGALSAAKAMLVDPDGKIRVSASYPIVEGIAKPTFDTRVAKAMPKVNTIRDFAQIARHIRSNKKRDSDIYWSGKESKRKMTTAASVFIYSTVVFPTGDGVEDESAGKFRYIVQLPMQSLLQPVTSVSKQISSGTGDISAAIKAKTQKSAAIILAVTSATLLVALVAAYFAARGVSKPLIQMAAVARAVGEGNLEHQALENSGGEIGEMGRAINAMISGLRQRNLLKDTFGRYTAPSVVEEVLQRGGTNLGGVKSQATVFFSDIAGFTTMAEGMAPEELVALLNEYFDAMTKIILASEGTLDKYIGDAILAFWGHPIAHEDDAVRSCRVALEQLKRLEELRIQWEAEGRQALDIRIGIETGDVIVGDIGSELKLNYTVLGDTVNFASRLEAVNKIYGTRILIGETTRLAAGDAIEVREIDKLAVVGKTISVRVYELVGMAGEISTMDRKGFNHYERALTLYRERQWSEAEDELMVAKGILGRDKACDVLLDRIAKLSYNPPPPDWDGSAILDHK